MQNIRWGIAGPGGIAKKFAKTVSNVEGATLSGVASRSIERAESFAKEYNIPNAFDGYEAMAKSPDIDAVYVATPHSHHKSVAEIFLREGKHVLCEKPICVNRHQLKSLSECAKKNGAFLMEAMWLKFMPIITKTREIIDSGAIGEIVSIETNQCDNVAIHAPEHNVYKNDMAGGALLDLGIYGLEFIAFFFGYEPEEIVSVCRVEKGVDVQTIATLKFQNGKLARMITSNIVTEPCFANVYGAKGYISIPDYVGGITKLHTYIDGKEEVFDVPPIGNGFEEEIYEACRCIREGKLESDVHPIKDSLAILSQMDTIRRQNGIKYPFDGEDKL